MVNNKLFVSNELILIKNDITYKFSKFDESSNITDKSVISNTTYLCTFWSSNLGSDPNDIFGREFTQEEYDKLFGKIVEKPPVNNKKLTKAEKEKLQRLAQIEETRKAMGL